MPPYAAGSTTPTGSRCCSPKTRCGKAPASAALRGGRRSETSSGECTGIMEKFINHPMFDELINKGYTTEQKPDHPDYTDEGFCRDMWTIINESESDSPEVIAALK